MMRMKFTSIHPSPILSFLTLLLLAVGSIPQASAIPEEDHYQERFISDVLPFLNHGTRFSFKSDDNRYDLSAVKFIHPSPEPVKGTILVLPGRSEPWLKYGEVFFDLYHSGYNLYSYDHRGQGWSPHLSPINHEIGHITRFDDYVDDLNVFVDNYFEPETSGKRYLLGHSMGGAIGAEYLSQNDGIFGAAVLSAPMLQINTKPYPEAIAEALAAVITGVGQGAHYAPGQGDYDYAHSPFASNIVTRSPNRFWMANKICELNPETVIGGPSSQWVFEGIKATHRIRKEMRNINTPFLLFQAMSDQIVKLKGQTIGCASTPTCKLIQFKDSQHEILNERDSIRDVAEKGILEFFGSH